MSAAGRRSRRRLLGASVPVSVVVFGWLLVGARDGDVAVAPDDPPFTMSLAGPPRIDAGDPWPIELLTEVPDEVVWVTVSGPWGDESVRIRVGDDARIVVPADLTTRSGRLLATVRAGPGSGIATVEVAPGPAVDGTTPLAGPRSMIADTAHWTMVTSLPRDRFGNAVADGTPVDVVVRRPSGGIEVVSTEAEYLMSAVRVFSETLAGRSTFRIDVGESTGSEVEVLEVPGPPIEVVVAPPPVPLLRADGRQLVVVSTARLVDRYGNELLDGTAALAVVDGPTGRSTLRSVTIDGRAEFVLESPPLPGPTAVEVTVDGVRSAPLVLEYVADVVGLPVRAVRSEGPGALVVLEIGPATTGLGGYVPDGTEAIVRVGDERTVVALADGGATLELDAVAGAAVTVEVLGTTTMVVAP